MKFWKSWDEIIFYVHLIPFPGSLNAIMLPECHIIWNISETEMMTCIVDIESYLINLSLQDANFAQMACNIVSWYTHILIYGHVEDHYFSATFFDLIFAILPFVLSCNICSCGTHIGPFFKFKIFCSLI